MIQTRSCLYPKPLSNKAICQSMQISCVEASQGGTWLLGSPLYPYYLLQKDIQHGHQNDSETITYSPGTPRTQQIQR